METLRRTHAHLDRTFSRLTVGFYNAVLPMRLRRAARDNPYWELDPDNVMLPFDLPPDDGDDGAAGSGVDGRRLLNRACGRIRSDPRRNHNGFPRQLAKDLGTWMVAMLLLAACAPAGTAETPPSPTEMEAHVRSLETLLPSLEALAVISWESSTSCKSIDYSRGNFQQDVPDGLSCYSSAKPAQPFDEQAEADFQRVAAAVRNVTFPLDSFGFVMLEGGRLVGASFSLGQCYAYAFDRTESLAAEVGPNISQVNGPWFLEYESAELFC